jgi:hypothetical protein
MNDHNRKQPDLHNLKGFAASKGFPGWFILDLEVLKKNIAGLPDDRRVIDISIPVLAAVWPFIETEVQRAGISHVACNNAQNLLSVSENFNKIMLEARQAQQVGYAGEGMTPVFSRYSQILELSNFAQNLDIHLSFLQRVRTADSSYAAGEFSAPENLQKLSQLPLVKLAGLFFDAGFDQYGIKSFQQLARQAAESTELQFITEKEISDVSDCLFLNGWELLGIGRQKVLPLALSCGLWAFFVKELKDGVILRLDMGKAQGLPADFPVFVKGKKAEVVEVNLNYSLVRVKIGLHDQPLPLMAIILGYDDIEPVSHFSWNEADLKNFIMHGSEMPTYLVKDREIIDLANQAPAFL